MKHTRTQIENTICKWSSYLLESKLASEDEVKEVLGEGLFKRAKTYVKNAFKHVGQGVASGIKKAALKVHDTFAANKGVSSLMDAVNKLYDSGKKFKDIKLFVNINKKTYPVAGFALSKSRKTLALLFDGKTKKAKTYDDLEDFLADNKVTGNGKQITDFVDSLVVGKIEDDVEMLSEAKSTSKRILKILDALSDIGWTSKKALNQNNIKNIMQLLGMKNYNTVAQEIADYYKSKGEKGVDDPTISSDDPSEDAAKSGDDTDKAKEDKAASEEKEDDKDDEKKAGDGKEGKEEEEEGKEEVPNFDKEEHAKPKSANHMLMKTKDGNVGVMDNPFNKVVTKDNFIGIFFDMSKEKAAKEQRKREALKH